MTLRTTEILNDGLGIIPGARGDKSMASRRAIAMGLMVGGTLCALLASRPVAAYTYLETAYGTPLVGLSTKGMGMGGAVTAVSDGSFSLVQNPAMLAWEGNQVADLTLRAVRYDETRFVPIFDTFDSFV